MQRKPKQLSGGQQQRVALGRCIVRNPQVFLFDEPLSNLDAKLRAQMRIEIKRLHAQIPTTSVFVTHDQVEAMTLGDRVVIMRDGRVQQVGTPLQVYGKPANKFVAGFIGAPAMNFITVTVRADAGATAVEAAGLKLTSVADARVLGPYNGRPVIMGVRPEHLALGDAAAGLGFDARVEVHRTARLRRSCSRHGSVATASRWPAWRRRRKSRAAIRSASRRSPAGCTFSIRRASCRFRDEPRYRCFTAPVGVAKPSMVRMRFSEPPAIFGRPVLEFAVDAEIMGPVMGDVGIELGLPADRDQVGVAFSRIASACSASRMMPTAIDAMPTSLRTRSA